MKKQITFKGNIVNVQDKGLEVGKEIPNFLAVKADLSDFNLADYKGKVVVINSFPSIDTGICALQTIKFNNEIRNYKDLVVVTVSKDLPFALGRFCAANDIENAITVSDYKYRQFEENVGGLIEELALLARQVIVVDKEGVIRHIELVQEVSSEPDYNKALSIVEKLV